MTELLESVDDIAVKIGFDAVSVSVAVRSAARNGATITVSKGV
jgi:hypothetical protein